MSDSYTFTETTTFTLTHARHIGAKVATDLKRVQRFYGEPSNYEISQFETEIIEVLKDGLLGTITYGYRRNSVWIEPTLRYTARDLAGDSANDDDPGRIRPGADTSGATFCSCLSYGPAWCLLTNAQQQEFEKRLPFRRVLATEPGVNGYWIVDRTYSSGGRAVDRASVRGY